MKHKHYEKLVLLDAPLPPKEAQTLHEHTAECDACYRLSRNWREAESLLLSSSQIAPDPGFTARWQARLSEADSRAGRRQSLWMLSLSGLGAAFFLVLFFWIWGQALDAGWIWGPWLADMATWGRAAAQFTPDFKSLTFHMPPSLPVLLVMAFFALLGAAGIAWLKILRLFMKYQNLTTHV